MISKLLLTKIVLTSVIASSCIGYVVFKTQATAPADNQVSNELSMENFSPNNAADDNEENTSLLGLGGGFDMGRVGK